MKVMFYCGLGTCEAHGTLEVDDIIWEAGNASTTCPECTSVLLQETDHFEDLNIQLQKERYALAFKKGSLTDAERQRLREIHRALGHHKPESFPPEAVSLTMKIASQIMAKIRNEETKN
jgi:hypothetical protein